MEALPSHQGTAASAPDRGWFGQPRGLTILFLTEMWERFSYYGMRALLVYYMTRQLLIGQEKASFIFGLYTGCVYLTPILGGYIADRWLGRRYAIIVGSSIMALGHLMMTSEALFYPALAAIAIGNGLFLPSLPSQIAGLYSADDPRRRSAFSIYYVGVNLGAFLAPLVCGTLGEVVGWHWGFGAAGIGMVAGLIIYIIGTPYLPPDRRVASKVSAPADVQARAEFRQKIPMLAAVGAAVVVFRAAYEQVGNTIALWAEQGVDRTLSGGWSVPMTWFQSLNPLLVFLLTPLLVARWNRQAEEGREMPSLRKMWCGASIVGMAYLLVAFAAFPFEGDAGQPSWIWLVAFFLLVTLGELYIIPVGLGLFGRLAPEGYSATVIAAWYLASFAGNLAAGAVGTLWSDLSQSGFFALIGGIAFTAAIGLRLLDRPSTSLEQNGRLLATECQ